MKTNMFPLAVVLGVVDTGYGIIRGLAAGDVQIIGIENGDQSNKPELKTSLCNKIYLHQNEDDLLRLLKTISDAETEKPVLFLSSDPYVEFFRKNSSLLSEKYRIHFTNEENASILLNKDKFCRYAEENAFLIPKTFIINSQNDFLKNRDKITFPCVLKPTWRTLEWTAANLNKVYFLNDKKELEKVYNTVTKVENRLIIQDLVPGSDDDIYFCLVYFDSNSNCIDSFVGKKIRQWPPGLGSTSSAKLIKNESVANATIHFFEGIGYAGFGSMEYKRSSADGLFYIMEPTVGRPDHQSFIATANGKNMPLMAYQNLINLECEVNTDTKKSVLWVDEQYELGSLIYLLRRKKIKIKDWYHTLQGKKSYRFINIKDPLPALFCILSSLKYLLKAMRGQKTI